MDEATKSRHEKMLGKWEKMTGSEDDKEERRMELAGTALTGWDDIGRTNRQIAPGGRKVKSPFDNFSADKRDLLDSKKTEEDKLKVKKERVKSSYKMWTFEGSFALPSNLVRSPSGWFLVPGIPTKDVPLRPDCVGDSFDARFPMRPLKLFGPADARDPVLFEQLHRRFWEVYSVMVQDENREAILAEVERERLALMAEDLDDAVRDVKGRLLLANKVASDPEASDDVLDHITRDAKGRLLLANKVASDPEARKEVAREMVQDKEACQEVAQQMVTSEQAQDAFLAALARDPQKLAAFLAKLPRQS